MVKRSEKKSEYELVKKKDLRYISSRIGNNSRSMRMWNARGPNEVGGRYSPIEEGAQRPSRGRKEVA